MWMHLWASLVLAWALLLHWQLDVLLEEQSHFLSWGLTASERDGSPTGVPETLMSDIGRARGSRVWAQGTRLLAFTEEAANGKAGGLSGLHVVSSGGMSAHGCTVAASTSPIVCMGTTQELSIVERIHVRSLTELAGLTWERTSLNVVSKGSHTLAHRSSCFSTNFPSAQGYWLKSCWSPWQSANLPSHCACAVHGAAPTQVGTSSEWPLAAASELC